MILPFCLTRVTDVRFFSSVEIWSGQLTAEVLSDPIGLDRIKPRLMSDQPETKLISGYSDIPLLTALMLSCCGKGRAMSHVIRSGL